MSATEQVIALDDPLFRSVSAALAFALNFAHDRHPASSIGQFIPGAAGRGLGGLDGAAQAGFVRCEIAACGELHAAILIAAYARPDRPCACGRACCSGNQRNPEWSDAIAWLAEHVRDVGLSGAPASYRARMSLVAHCFGAKIALVDLAQGLGRDPHTVGAYRAAIAGYFDGVSNKDKGARARALDAIGQRLRRAGMVGV